MLLFLAGGMLVYRSFRERYLLFWVLGWLSYLVHKLLTPGGELVPVNVFWVVVSQACFAAAALLMCYAVLFYTHRRRYLLPLAGLALLALGLALVRDLGSPGSAVLVAAGYVTYAAMTGTAAVFLALYSRGRRNVGAWLLTGTMVLLHADPQAATEHALAGVDLAIEVLLGLGMFLVVLDDSASRSRRVQLVNALTNAIASASDSKTILEISLRELRDITGSRAAWFRVLQGDQLLMVAQLGVSEEYRQERHALPVDQSLSGRVLREGKSAMVAETATIDDELRGRLQQEGYQHVLLIPVHGKSAVIGTLSLARNARREYSPDELHFLESTANQIGMALESLLLVEQILRSQRQWVSTFDSIQDLIVVHDEQSRIIKVNRALAVRIGYHEADLVGKSCGDVLPRARERVGACPYCARAGAAMIELPDPCFGGWSLVSTSSYTEGGAERKGTIHIVRDTTDRRSAEEKYRMLFEQIQEGVFISTPEGRLLECNDAFARMLGYAGADELRSLDIATHMYADPEKRREFMREIEEHSYVRAYEVELRRKDGSAVIALETSVATRDEDGRIVRYQGFLLDITEKKKAENEIRRRNRELFALNAIATASSQSLDLLEMLDITLRHTVELFAADTGSVYLVDPDTQTLRRAVGFGHRSQLGIEKSEVDVPADFWDLVTRSRTQIITHTHLPHLPQVVRDIVGAEDLKAWIWCVLWSKEKIIGLLGVGSRTQRDFTVTDDSLMVAIGRQLATTIEKVRLYEETRRAYDHLRLTQEQLLQSEKMSAVGQLISGVAHELNNPLTAIMGYSQLLESEQLEPRTHDFVDKIHKQALRTHKIVQNLLSFARQRKPEKTAVDIRRVVEDTLALRDYDLRLNNIVVQRDFGTPVPTVVVDAHQMEQVFLNIVNNAVDAMLERSRQGTLRVRVFLEDGMVCIEFHDTGPGIKDPNRVFDPFYTTKGVGKGTGLGLSICYGIIKEHGGMVRASNHSGGGAVFHIALPAGAQMSGSEERPRADAAPPISGRILLVDDEAAVLDFEREVLSAAGAEVVAVSNGQQAIELLQSDDFDALVVDGKMPGLDGPDVYRWIAENRPGLERRLLLSVSDISDPDLRTFIRERGVRCIVKPFQVPDLLSMMRRMLQHRHVASAS